MDENIQGTPSPSPPPCAKNCGFFGSPSTMNMCSKCFGEHQRSNPESRAAAAAVEAATAGSSAATAAATAGAVTGSAVPASIASVAVPVPVPTSGTPTATVEVEDNDININKKKERKVQKNTSRCWACRKKIGLTGFQCRCDYFFCSSCRYPDDHKCDFDYQASAREQLEKNNPVVVASKLDKI